MSTILKALEKVEGEQRGPGGPDLGVLARTDVEGEAPQEAPNVALPGEPFRPAEPRRTLLTRGLAVLAVVGAIAGMTWLLFEDPTPEPVTASAVAVAPDDPGVSQPSADDSAARAEQVATPPASIPAAISDPAVAAAATTRVASLPTAQTEPSMRPDPAPVLAPSPDVPRAGRGARVPAGPPGSSASPAPAVPPGPKVSPAPAASPGAAEAMGLAPAPESAPALPPVASAPPTRRDAEVAPIAAEELEPERVEGLEGVETLAASAVVPPPAVASTRASASPPPAVASPPPVAAPAAPKPKVAPRKRSAAKPRVATIPPAPTVKVERTTWHPTPERREARVVVEGFDEPLDLHEGDAVGVLVVSEIQPSAVVFLHGGGTLRRKVGR